MSADSPDLFADNAGKPVQGLKTRSALGGEKPGADSKPATGSPSQSEQILSVITRKGS
jgi:hypothetical protein